MKQENEFQGNDLKIRIYAAACRQTGAWNLQAGRECEDMIYIRETPEFVFYGIADGQSGKSHGADGGYACLEAAADYIQRRGVSGLIDAPFPDELPCMLTRIIRRRLLSLAGEQGGSFSDYASTLLAVAVDPVTCQYVLLHLGDGCAIGVQRDNALLILSPPENGSTKQYTWLTTGLDAVSHMRLAFGTLQGKRRMLLLSDGANCLCRGKNLLRQARELILTGTQEEIMRYLNDAKLSDDASGIVLDFVTACDS